jgi:putative transposase
MIKGIKVQLKPNNRQQTKLFQSAGVARFAYNWALNR